MRTQEMIRFLRWYADERINSQLMDERRCIPHSMVVDLSAAGLLGLQTERQYGGQELSHVDTARVLEQAAAIDANLAVSLCIHNGAGVMPIRRFCSDKIKSSVLPQLTTGGALGAIAVSEPALGTNIRAMTTTAVRRPGGGYTVNGCKALISFGAWAPHVNLFARLIDDSGEDRGITAFLVRTNNPGWRPESEAMTLGIRAIPQNLIAIEDLQVQPDALMGEEGAGATIVRCAFDFTRWMLGSVALGAMKRSLQVSVRYATRRTVATGRLLDNGNAQRIFSEAVAATQTVEALTTFLSERLDKGLEAETELCLVCKIITAELAWQVIDSSVQMMGARGFLDTTTVGRNFRDYRILRIFEGATEGITVYLGRTILLAPDAFVGLLSSIFPSSSVISGFATVLAELTERAERDPTPQELHRTAAATGNLAAWTITSAALTMRTAQNPTELSAYALDWCGRQIQRRIDEARSVAQSKGSWPQPELLAEHIAGYAETIGDTEQSYQGDARVLEPWLSREGVTAR